MEQCRTDSAHGHFDVCVRGTRLDTPIGRKLQQSVGQLFLHSNGRSDTTDLHTTHQADVQTRVEEGQFGSKGVLCFCRTVRRFGVVDDSTGFITERRNTVEHIEFCRQRATVLTVDEDPRGICVLY